MSAQVERTSITRTEFYSTMSTVMFLIGLVFMNTSRSEDEWYRSIPSLVVGLLLCASGFFYLVAGQKARPAQGTEKAPPAPPGAA